MLIDLPTICVGNTKTSYDSRRPQKGKWFQVEDLGSEAIDDVTETLPGHQLNQCV